MKKIFILIIFSIYLFPVLANSTLNQQNSPLEGIAYYCSPNGNMENTGTSPAEAWADLETVMTQKTFNEGDTIFLMSGEHGFPLIQQVNSGTVVISGYQNDTVVLKSIRFSNASNWLLKNVEIFPDEETPESPVLDHPVYPKLNNSMIQISACSDINIENCYAYSATNTKNWTENEWNYEAWNGILIRDNSQDITVSNCYFKNVNFGFLASGGSNITLEYTTIENFCGDGIRPDCSNALIQHNIVKNCYETNGNHDDLLQLYSGGDISNVTIKSNIFINNSDPNQLHKGTAQGIVGFDGMYYNCVIENNVVVTNHWHGITLLGAENCQVLNNTAIDENNTSPGPCWIQVAAHKDGRVSTGNIVRNNICTNLANDANIGEVDHNQEINYSDYDNYFVDFDNLDLHLKTGCPAIDAGSSNNAPSIDLEGNPRPHGENHDLGAYEYSSTLVSVTGVSFASTHDTINVGGIKNLTVEISPSDATNQSVIWQSNDIEIVHIDDNGKISALSEGEAIITVTTVDGDKTATLYVTVEAATSDYNLALFKPVTVSSFQNDEFGNKPGENLVDGELSEEERWSAEGMPQNAEIDLGDDYHISKVCLYTYQQRAYQYTIEAKTKDGDYETIVDRSSNNEGSHPFTDSVTATAGYIKVMVTGAENYSGSWISLVELQVFGSPVSTGTGALSKKLRNLPLTLYPNPTKGDFYIQLPDNNMKNLILQVVDLTGKKVFETYLGEPGKKVHINVENLTNGVYIVSLSNTEFTQHTKIVLEH